MTCPVCHDRAREQPFKLRGFTVPGLCAVCYTAIKEAQKRGQTYDLTVASDRDRFLDGPVQDVLEASEEVNA